MRYEEVIARLESLADPAAVEGMARYGITANKVYGVSIPNLRLLAKEIGKDHELAGRLWQDDARETRILACMVDPPRMVDEEQAERWVADFDSWEVCDQCCANLLEGTPFAYAKAAAWSERPEEFVKRAGFVLMARLAVSDKREPDERFAAFLPLILREATDKRNFVKKAVNWALRQIGKRDRNLNRLALATAREMQSLASPAARWIAADAIRELQSEYVQQRLAGK